MDFHSVGNVDRFERGTSLAVVRSAELVRGERDVRRPANQVRVCSVEGEEGFCLCCCGVRQWDVARDSGRQVVFKRCRYCGKEV